VTAYNDGDAYLIRFSIGNTTGATLNINSLGAKDLYRNNNGLLIGGDIIDGAEMFCIYNTGMNGFQVIGTAPNTLLAYVTNVNGSTITRGQPVYAFGGQGDRLTVKLASNSTDASVSQLPTRLARDWQSSNTCLCLGPSKLVALPIVCQRPHTLRSVSAPMHPKLYSLPNLYPLTAARCTSPYRKSSSHPLV
jgi:hypothetical protein